MFFPALYPPLSLKAVLESLLIVPSAVTAPHGAAAVDLFPWRGCCVSLACSSVFHQADDPPVTAQNSQRRVLFRYPHLLLSPVLLCVAGGEPFSHIISIVFSLKPRPCWTSPVVSATSYRPRAPAPDHLSDLSTKLNPVDQCLSCTSGPKTVCGHVDMI